jgi:hypothetical protein
MTSGKKPREAANNKVLEGDLRWEFITAATGPSAQAHIVFSIEMSVLRLKSF